MQPEAPGKPKIVVIAGDLQSRPGEPRDGPLAGGKPAAGNENPSDSGLLVMLVERPGIVGADDRRRSEEWLMAGKASAAMGNVMMQSDEIRLRGNRALVVADVHRTDDYLAVLSAFAGHERRIEKLETEVGARWQGLVDDVPLTGAASFRDLARQAEINRVMLDLIMMRVELVSLDQLIYLPATSLPPVAHRLLNELALTSRHADRVRALDERLDVLEETYRDISGRLNDLALHRREIAVELVIVLLLAVEAVTLVLPLFR